MSTPIHISPTATEADVAALVNAAQELVDMTYAALWGWAETEDLPYRVRGHVWPALEATKTAIAIVRASPVPAAATYHIDDIILTEEQAARLGLVAAEGGNHHA